MKVTLLLVLAAVAIALAANPTAPKWPGAFSASVMATGGVGQPPRFFRWFYSDTIDKGRFDGMGYWNDEMVLHRLHPCG